MRYLKIFENYQTEEVAKICQQYGIINWSINQDGLVDVDNSIVDLSHNKLTKLPLKFGMVTGDFFCTKNRLTTLEGAPYSVGGNFYCSYNKLTTLEGAPQSVSGGFYCGNNKLTTLKGAPYSVGSIFYCDYNPLPDLIQKNIKHIRHILANQEMYHIYNKDGSINEYRFQLMMDSMD